MDPTKRCRLTILIDLLVRENFPYRHNLTELDSGFDPTYAEVRRDGYWEVMAPDGAHVLVLNRIELPSYFHTTWEMIDVRRAYC